MKMYLITANSKRFTRFAVQISVFVMVCAVFFGYSLTNAIASEPDKSLASAPSLSAEAGEQTEKANMVDERFELLSLVFRLANHDEYSDIDTEYQHKLASAFDEFKEHPAVKYASELPLGYDAVFKFSVHILKGEDCFVFIPDIDSLVEDGRWSIQSATDFLPLLNDFYAQTGFAEFYLSNTEFYEAETQHFIEQIYSAIDFEWFRTYVDPANLRCIYSPSSSRCNYAATVNDTIIYCAITGEGSSIIHEFCHSFANPIAHKWYDDNDEFKEWCDNSISPSKLPQYTNGKIMAGEYMTRAYNTLYYADHGTAPLRLLLSEKGRGFTYMEDVYAMITPYEKMAVGDDRIEILLGVKYEMGSEQSYDMGSRVIRWNVLILAEPLTGIFPPTEVGNVFNSKTGDVLYVDNPGTNPYLIVDLGETVFQGKSGFRSYSRIPLE